MRVVAIRAGHSAFFHAVFEWHRELHAYVGVAFFTQRGLRLAQQRAQRLGVVNRMAAGTRHSVQRVLGVADICAGKRLAVERRHASNVSAGGSNENALMVVLPPPLST